MTEVFKIDTDIYRINETVYPYVNVDAYLLDLKDKAVLIDTLEDIDDVQEVYHNVNNVEE